MILHHYVDVPSGFVLGVPEGWRVGGTGVLGTRLVVFAPTAADDFQANVNVTAQDLGDVTPAEAVAVTRSQLKQLAGTPLLDVDMPAANPAAGHVFGWTLHRAGSPIRSHQVLAFHHNRWYAVTLTARPEQFHQLLPAFEAMLGSFQFLDPQTPTETPPVPPAPSS